MNEIIITLIITIGLGGFAFISTWLGYIAGHSIGYDKGKKEGSIEELENVKDKINIKRDNLLNIDDRMNDLNIYKKCKIQGYSDSIGIIDKHIAELKGNGE